MEAEVKVHPQILKLVADIKEWNEPTVRISIGEYNEKSNSYQIEFRASELTFTPIFLNSQVVPINLKVKRSGREVVARFSIQPN